MKKLLFGLFVMIGWLPSVRAASVGFGDFNTNQFGIVGNKVYLLNGAFVTNLTFNTFTVPGSGTNSTTYIFPLTNFISGQLITVITNGNLVYFEGTNLPVSTVVFDTIEELVATPIPLPGIGLLAYVRDPLRGGPFAFYPQSIKTPDNFKVFASTDGPGNWERPPDPDIRVEWGVVTGGVVTNATLAAALALQSAQGTGKVVYSGTDEFLETDDVPLLDNNVLYGEDGAQATGLVLSANGKTNIAVYGMSFIAPVADPSLAVFYITNTINTVIQGSSFVGYSGATKVEVTTLDSKSWAFNSDGLTLDQGPKGSGALQTWQNGGTNKLRLLWDGTFDPAIGGGATINPTDGFTPYRFSSATFSNSPLYRISDIRMGFGDTDSFLFFNQTNIGIGSRSLEAITTGINNTALGENALLSNTSGTANTAVGYLALGSDTTGSANTAVGKFAGASVSSGGSHTFVGSGAGQSVTTAGGNSAFGNNALNLATTGFNESAFGQGALQLATTGSYNSAFGHSALNHTTTGQFNSSVGLNSGFSNTIGGFNAVLGFGAMNNPTNVSYGTFLGSNADAVSDAITNAAAIGHNAKTTNDNQMVFGTTLNTYDFPGATMTLNGLPVMTGSGSGITGSGTANTFPIWTGVGTQGDSTVADAGSTISFADGITAPSVQLTNNATFVAGTNVAQIVPSTTSTFPQNDRSVGGGITMSSLQVLLNPHQDFNFIQEPLAGGGGGMVTFRGTQGLGFVPNINGPDYGPDIGGIQYRTPVESMSNNFFIFRGGQYLWENEGATWMMSLTPFGLNVGSLADNTLIPLSKFEVNGNASIGAAYARVSAAPANGLIVQGRIGAGIVSPGFPFEVAGTDATSIAYQRTGVSAKKWGFDSDNSNTYWRNITDGTTPFSLSNGGNVSILGTLQTGGNVGIGIAPSVSYPLEISSNTNPSFAYQRTGVSAKKWGFSTDNSNTYWGNITDGTNPLTLSNEGNLTALGIINGTSLVSTGATNYMAGSLNIGATNVVGALSTKQEIGSSSSGLFNIVTKVNADSPYTATASNYTIVCDAVGGAITINLPAAASHSGRIYNVKKTDSSVNAVTIDGNASETIDGSTTQVIGTQYNAFTIQSDGTNWHIL